jgi:hypothetical protein
MSDEDDDIDELGKKRICWQCIGDDFLCADVKKTGVAGECSYCGGERKTVSIEDLADRVEYAFEQHYRLTPDEPSAFEYTMIKEGDYNWEREGEPAQWAIANAAQIEEEPAEDVREFLADRHYDFDAVRDGDQAPFSEEAHYEEEGVHDAELQEEWRWFQRSLKTEARLFNSTAEAVLKSIFEGIDKHATFKGKKVIVKAGPGKKISALYRARVFQSDEKLKAALERPDRELGPPPAAVAMAGRMNSRGIAVFYGATAADVALAETRPPVGSRVLVGRFELTRDLKLLDVEALRSIYVKGSVFDPDWLSQLQKAKFLKSLSQRITMPVMPEDETLEYLVTQAIADYLANQHALDLDGIIYPSVQDGKKKRNVVLFHKAARVERIEVVPGTVFMVRLESTYDDDGPVPDYFVWVQEPAPKKTKKKKSGALVSFDFDPEGFVSPMLNPDADARLDTLRVDTESLQVHDVQSVKFTAPHLTVTRHKSVKPEIKF